MRKCIFGSVRTAKTCAFTQSDPNLHRSPDKAYGPCLSTERIAKILIRLRGCAGLSEFSVGAQVRKYIFLHYDSILTYFTQYYINVDQKNKILIYIYNF